MDIELNQLIDNNLKIISGSKLSYSNIYDLVDKDGYGYTTFDAEIFADKMVNKLLIERHGDRISLTEIGKDIISKGGWLAHLDRLVESKAKQQIKLDQRELLETELAKSNIEANKLNAKIAEQNRKDRRLNKIFLIINVVFMALNMLVAVLQLMKPVK